jgi:hypothetical protein
VPGGFACVWPGNACGRPVVLTSHGTDLFLLDRFPVARAVAGPIFRAAAQVTVISSPLVHRVAQLGVPAGRVTVLPMPVSAERFAAPLHNLRDTGCLLFVGRLIREGPEYAIAPSRAAAAGQGRAPDRHRGRPERTAVSSEALHPEMPWTWPAPSARRRGGALPTAACSSCRRRPTGRGTEVRDGPRGDGERPARRGHPQRGIPASSPTATGLAGTGLAALAAAAARLTIRTRAAGRRRACRPRRPLSPDAIAAGFDAVYRRALEAA